MTSREFFYCVSNMREAQRNYFRTRDRHDFLRARACENEVDREIARVRELIRAQEQKNMPDGMVF